MPAELKDLTTIASVKLHAIIDDTDADIDTRLTALVREVSVGIQRLISRALVRQTITSEYHDGDAAVRNKSVIYLDEFPVNSVTEVKENGTAVTVATGYSTTADVILIPKDGILAKVSTTSVGGTGLARGRAGFAQWQPGLQNIEVTYNAGFDFPRAGDPEDVTNLPEDIELCAKKLVALFFKEGPRIDQARKSYPTWSLEFIRQLDPWCAAIIQSYERGFRP